MPDLHAPKREVGAELAPRSLAPGDAAKRPSTERQGKGARALPLATPAVGPIDEPHRCRRVDAQSVVETQHADRLAEVVRVAVGAVAEQHVAGYTVLDRACDHVERQVVFRLETHLVGDLALRTALRIARPALRQVQLGIDRHVRASSRDAQRHPDLAVGDLPRRPRVLPLHAHRVLSLLEKTRVVDDPGRDRLPRAHRFDGVTSCHAAYSPIVPRRVRRKVKQLLVIRIAAAWIVTRGRGDRLGALAFQVAQQAEGVDPKRLTPLLVGQSDADLGEVAVQPTAAVGIQFVPHASPVARNLVDGKVCDAVVLGSRVSTTAGNFSIRAKA